MSVRPSTRRRNSRKAVRTARPQAATFHVGRVLTRAALLTGVSALALWMAPAQARSPGSSVTVMSAPNFASDAATLAAPQAASVARQSSAALSRATQAIQAMQAVQSAARAAAQGVPHSNTLNVNVPNGLAAGGLVPDMPAGWSGANAPTQSAGNGQTVVGIDQTAPQAILNWQTFNVGSQTTVNFNQQGNASWVALNRVTGNLGPSQILGNINTTGQVYVINQNGIIFGARSMSAR